MTTFIALVRRIDFNRRRDGSIMRSGTWSFLFDTRFEISGPHSKQMKAVDALYQERGISHPDEGFEIEVNYTGRTPVRWLEREEELHRVYNPLAKETV